MDGSSPTSEPSYTYMSVFVNNFFIFFNAKLDVVFVSVFAIQSNSYNWDVQVEGCFQLVAHINSLVPYKNI